MVSSKVFPAAVIALIYIAGVSASIAYYFYGQLNDANAVIQKSFVEREFNYAIVLTVNESGCNCPNGTACFCIVTISFPPALQNISLMPLDNARAVSGVSDASRLPSAPLNLSQGDFMPSGSYIEPIAFAYNFTSVAFNQTEMPNGDGTISYLNYTGQITIIYPVNSSTIAFNYIGWADNQSGSLLNSEVVPLPP